MNLRKRRENNDIVHQNKKQKVQNETTTIISKKLGYRFENLPNEIIYELFEYIDTYDIYHGFFNLNERFKNLLMNSNVPIRINISTMSKSKFDYYHQNIIIPNKQRINYLHLSNPFTVDIIFSPPKIISKFIQLQTLVLDNIDATYLKNILKHSIHLPKLYSLSIHLIDFIKNSTDFYLQIFRLPKLKYVKLNFQIMDHLNLSSISTNISSPIEHFVYGPLFPLESFENLLSYLPQLRRLSIDGIHDFHHKEIDFSPIVLKSFKNVSLKLRSMNFNQLEQIIKNYFQYIEVLHITSSDDPEFLNAKRWEKIILSSMPNLRIFDMNHTGLAEEYHDLINQFNSSFWINKQWFFTHQHTWKENSDSGIFYSTHPYRRKDYTLDDWQKNEQTCSNNIQINSNSVKHVFIDGKQVSKNSLNYFPHATELTIKNYLNKCNDSISKIFSQIIPLKQLVKLTIAHFIFPFEQLMQLLLVTPNLVTIKYYLSFFNQVDLKSINLKDLSFKNKVKRLEIHPEGCTIEQFQFILNLFLQLEYLKVGMSKEEIQQFIQYLSLKTIVKTHPLFFLCISQLRKKFIPELNRLIKSKNLHDDYFIKIVYCNLFLWW